MQWESRHMFRIRLQISYFCSADKGALIATRALPAVVKLNAAQHRNLHMHRGMALRWGRINEKNLKIKSNFYILITVKALSNKAVNTYGKFLQKGLKIKGFSARTCRQPSSALQHKSSASGSAWKFMVEVLNQTFLNFSYRPRWVRSQERMRARQGLAVQVTRLKEAHQ